MTIPDDTSTAQLYLGRDWPTASALGPRRFRNARQALRFAFEHAAPVSLRGARLLVAGRSFAGDDLASLNRLRLAQPAA
jgi:hypothetical protein